MDVNRSSLTYTYRLDSSRFQPIVNVLVQQGQGADGSPRFQIESQGQLVAMSGTNWRSPFFAEVFVYALPAGQGRGWAKSVVSACTASLLEDRLRPLYIVEEGNQASFRIAEGLGYVTTGHCEFVGEGHLR
jgi:predicted GNAT family acetyltransferase